MFEDRYIAKIGSGRHMSQVSKMEAAWDAGEQALGRAPAELAGASSGRVVVVRDNGEACHNLVA